MFSKVGSVEKHLPEIDLFYSGSWEDGGGSSLRAASQIDPSTFSGLISYLDAAGIVDPVALIQAHRKMIIADHLCSASYRQVDGIYEKIFRLISFVDLQYTTAFTICSNLGWHISIPQIMIKDIMLRIKSSSVSFKKRSRIPATTIVHRSTMKVQVLWPGRTRIVR